MKQKINKTAADARPGENLVVGRRLRYKTEYYTITKLSPGRMFIRNNLRGELNISRVLAIRWTEQGVLKFFPAAPNH